MTEITPLTTTPDLIAAADILAAAERSSSPSFMPYMMAQVFAAAVLEEDFGIADVADNPEAIAYAFRTFILALKDPMHPDLDRFRADPDAGEAARAEVREATA